VKPPPRGRYAARHAKECFAWTVLVVASGYNALRDDLQPPPAARDLLEQRFPQQAGDPATLNPRPAGFDDPAVRARVEQLLVQAAAPRPLRDPPRHLARAIHRIPARYRGQDPSIDALFKLVDGASTPEVQLRPGRCPPGEVVRPPRHLARVGIICSSLARCDSSGRTAQPAPDSLARVLAIAPSRLRSHR
jgi:hypothetical protein